MGVLRATGAGLGRMGLGNGIHQHLHDTLSVSGLMWLSCVASDAKVDQGARPRCGLSDVRKLPVHLFPNVLQRIELRLRNFKAVVLRSCLFGAFALTLSASLRTHTCRNRQLRRHAKTHVHTHNSNTPGVWLLSMPLHSCQSVFSASSADKFSNLAPALPLARVLAPALPLAPATHGQTVTTTHIVTHMHTTPTHRDCCWRWRWYWNWGWLWRCYCIRCHLQHTERQLPLVPAHEGGPALHA